MKILIVEDDFSTRRIMSRFLEGYGEVDIAIDGLEGFEAFQLGFESDKKYDVLFLDIQMPKSDGQELLQNIREFEYRNDITGKDGVRIVMTTILSDSKDIIKAFREQCEAYIVKPVEKEEIHRVLKKLELI